MTISAINSKIKIKSFSTGKPFGVWLSVLPNGPWTLSTSSASVNSEINPAEQQVIVVCYN